MKINELLSAMSAYPIPSQALDDIARRWGFSLDTEVAEDIVSSRELMMARADVYTWLSLAPDVSQGGQSYSFTDDQRAQFRNLAKGISYEVFAKTSGAVFGYKGSRL